LEAQFYTKCCSFVTETIQSNVSDLVYSYLCKSTKTTNANVRHVANLLEELFSLHSGELTLTVEDFLSKDDIEDIIAHISAY
jgi:hypothetical protein